jgi:hypothetical protein
MDEIWMSIDEYAELTRLDLSAIDDLITREKLNTKTENGRIYIDPSKGMQSVLPVELEEVKSDLEVSSDSEVIAGPYFVEKTIGTIINLHEKVIDAKDETIESIKSENLFLKEAISSLQELYEEDRKTIETLTSQLQLSQKEVEFLRRKYKLMWGKVVEEYGDK